MKTIKKLMVLALIFLATFLFVGCKKDDEEGISYIINLYNENSELVNSKEIKGSTTDNLFEVLKTNFTVVYTESEFGPYITEIDSLKAQGTLFIAIYENNLPTQVGIGELVVDDKDVFDFKLESWEVPAENITYTISVYDIDNELLEGKQISASPNESFFDILKANFDVEYTTSEYGAYITSINGSVVDNNYFLALYENDQLAETGVEGIVVDNNDKFEFRVECWNTELDEVDKQVDILIYSFFKNKLNEVFTETNADFYLLSAIQTMQELGYDKRVFNVDLPNKDKYIENYSQDYTGVTSVGTLFKAAVGCDFFGLDNKSLKTQVESIEETESLLSIYSIAYYLVACEKLGIENDTYLSVLSKFGGVIANAAASDSTNICLQVFGENKEANDYKEVLASALEKLEATVSSEGVTESWSGLNCASTAQAILALVANNCDPKNFNSCDLISALLTFEEDGCFKNKLDSESVSLLFDTPQALAALLAYKAYNDTGKPVIIFE